MTRPFYEIGDYIEYVGEDPILDKSNHQEYFAKILSRKKIGNKWVVEIKFILSGNQISCDEIKIRPIITSEKHLLEFGFREQSDRFDRVSYVMNDIVIIQIGIGNRRFNQRTVFISGFCIADFRNHETINLEKYQEGDSMKSEKFYSDFPSVYYLKDLFNYLENEKKLTIDKEKIVKC